MQRHPPLPRIMLSVAFTIVVTAFAIRMAAVRAYAETRPEFAARFWPNHPDVLASTAMLEVAQAAARKRPLPRVTWSRLTTLSHRSPLAPQPFLVGGARELKDGHASRAEPLLLAARRRDPRSPAALYLLSELYLQDKRMGPALGELAVLGRLLPELAGTLAPTIARHAETVGATPQLKRALEQNPQLANRVLSELASDYRNTDLIMALAETGDAVASDATWKQKLSSSLIAAGAYKRAFALWRRYAPRADTMADLSGFRRSEFPSPFTWSYAKGNAGAADPTDEGLRITFSGTENVSFASRTTLLPPGRYDLSMQIEGDMPVPGSVSWSVTCASNHQRLASLEISHPGQLVGQFQVGPQCSAERFELKGTNQTFPHAADFTIRNFRVRRLSQ